MRDRGWVAFFAGVPALTMALLLMSFTVSEPFPTLLMPGFSGANDLAEMDTVERTVFIVGSDEVVTGLQFAALDFTQSQASPLMAGLLKQAPLDVEANSWVHERLAEIVGEELCGQPVSLVRETVAVTPESSSIIRLDSQNVVDLGPLICGQ